MRCPWETPAISRPIGRDTRNIGAPGKYQIFIEMLDPENPSLPAAKSNTVTAAVTPDQSCLAYAFPWRAHEIATGKRESGVALRAD
jgi:hypothetical protein